MWKVLPWLMSAMWTVCCGWCPLCGTVFWGITHLLPCIGNLMNPAAEKGLHRCFCVRMKSTLTKRGVHVKSSGYRVSNASALSVQVQSVRCLYNSLPTASVNISVLSSDVHICCLLFEMLQPEKNSLRQETHVY